MENNLILIYFNGMLTCLAIFFTYISNEWPSLLVHIYIFLYCCFSRISFGTRFNQMRITFEEMNLTNRWKPNRYYHTGSDLWHIYEFTPQIQAHPHTHNSSSNNNSHNDNNKKPLQQKQYKNTHTQTDMQAKAHIHWYTNARRQTDIHTNWYALTLTLTSTHKHTIKLTRKHTHVHT